MEEGNGVGEKEMKCFEPGGWLFPEPFKSQIHDILQTDIDELLQEAEQEGVLHGRICMDWQDKTDCLKKTS